jgi:hypothetical protein
MEFEPRRAGGRERGEREEHGREREESGRERERRARERERRAGERGEWEIRGEIFSELK